MCKQHHRTALNPSLNGTKNGDIDGARLKGSFTLIYNDGGPRIHCIQIIEYTTKEIDHCNGLFRCTLLSCLMSSHVRSCLMAYSDRTYVGTGPGLGPEWIIVYYVKPSHCNLCGNLNRSHTLALYQSWSRPQSRSHISSVWLDHECPHHMWLSHAETRLFGSVSPPPQKS